MQITRGWAGPIRVAALAGLALALGAAACGDEEPADSPATDATAKDRPPAAVFDPPVTSGGDRVYVAEVVRDVQEGLMAGHAASVCFELSGRAERRLLGPSGRPPRTCEAAVQRALDRWRAAGEEPIVSEIEGIEIDGDEALVTLDVPNLGQRQVRVVRTDGWDLPILRLDHPPGFELLSVEPSER